MRNVVYVRSGGIYDDSRATKEIFALLENNYHVTVVGWDRFGNACPKCKELFSEYAENVTFYFYEKLLPNGGNIGSRNIIIMLKWLWWSRRILKRLVNTEIVHLCNLDAALAISRKMRKKVKIVYDIFDYYIDSHRIPKLFKKYVEKLEIQIINASDLTIICTEERKEQIKKATPQKLIVLYNSPEINEVYLSDIEYDYVYCGGLNEGRLIKETFEEYTNNKDIKVAFAGFGKYENSAKDMSSRYPDFDFLGHMQYSDVLKVEAKAKVLSAIYNPILRNHRLCAPNKFYEAMALGKPIIVCGGTGIDQITKEYNLGIVINYDSKELYSAIRRLKDDPQLCEVMGRNARMLYEKEYAWIKMKKRLLEAYNCLNDN